MTKTVFCKNRQNQCPVNVQNNDDAEVEHGIRFVWNEERIYRGIFTQSCDKNSCVESVGGRRPRYLYRH